MMRRQLSLVMILSLAAVPTAAQDQTQRSIRFAAMDENRDGVITKQEWRGSAQSFQVHDWNRDGVLSGDEVRVGARRSNDPREPDLVESDQREFTDWTASGFTSLDHNRNGRVTRDEWHFDLASFRRADHNRDGWLSRAEFLGDDSPTDDDRNDRFNIWDTNGDGLVSRREWQGTTERFAALDGNRDDRVSRSEFRGEDPETRSGAYRQGQDRGLAEGRQAGKEDKQNNAGWDLEGQRELEQADSGYQAAFGPRAEYQSGYREGFRRGYREGFGRSLTEAMITRSGSARPRR